MKPALTEKQYLNQKIQQWENSQAPNKTDMINFYKRRRDGEEEVMHSVKQSGDTMQKGSTVERSLPTSLQEVLL